MSSRLRRILQHRAHHAAVLTWAGILFSGSQNVAAEKDEDLAGRTPASSFIGFYQRHLSELRNRLCPFDPSCSEYALGAIRERGLLFGSALMADRLMRCNASAGRYYARGENDRLQDPVEGEAPARFKPHVPPWLLPSLDIEPSGGFPRSTPAAFEYASFAEALARDGDCERASTEFRRAAHSARTPGVATWAYLRSGACFFALERWETASDEFLQAAATAQTSQEQNTGRRYAAACQFNEGNYAASEFLLLDSNRFLDDDGEALSLLGLCDMTAGRWDRARQRFTTALEGSAGRTHPAKLRYLIDQTVKGEQLPHRSPGFAAALSAVVPGSGQMYCGRVQDGLRHLVFNGALIYSIVELARGGHYAATYLVAGIELPFYLGNIFGARHSAQTFNRNARLTFVASTLTRTEN